MFPYDLPFLPGASDRPSAGTSSSSATPKSPRSATSSGWSACPARRSGSTTATSSSSRRAATRSGSRASRLTHQAAMQMIVYDDRHRPRALADQAGVAALAAAAPGGWTSDRARASAGTGPTARTGDEWAELRYRHLVPDPEQWDAILNDRTLPARPRADADHRLLLVQHQPDRPRAPTSPDESTRRAGRRLDAAALGRRPDARRRTSRSQSRPGRRSGSS